MKVHFYVTPTSDSFVFAIEDGIGHLKQVLQTKTVCFHFKVISGLPLVWKCNLL